MRHPMEGVRLHRRWLAMVNRCHLPTSPSYRDYGGRGIKVCERWRKSFDAFFEDMGWPPMSDAQIERKDNDGPYSPENCEWASQIKNQSNKRNTKLITANGETLHQSEWARRLNCNPSAIIHRIKSGMNPEDAVTKPIPERPNSKLTMAKARAIRAAFASKSSLEIAAEYGVSKKTVLNIIHGKIYRE